MFALNLISVLLSNAFFLHYFMFLGDPFFCCVYTSITLCVSLSIFISLCVCKSWYYSIFQQLRILFYPFR